MAERRMLTRKVTDDDNFMALSSSAQALYLHLNMAADDDGFNNQVSVCMFKAHASIDDLKALLEKRYLYQFDNGVIVVKHWRMANALRKDRYTPTAFKEELAKLGIKENGSYTWQPNGNQLATKRQPIGNQTATQDRLDKNSLDKNSLGYIKQNLFSLTEEEFGRALSDTEKTELARLVDQYGTDKVTDALREASIQKVLKVAYMRGILKNNENNV